MKRFSFPLLLLLIVIASILNSILRAGAPEISGRVMLVGTPPAEIRIVLDPSSAKLRPNGLTTRHYVTSPGGGLGNVFVWIKSGVSSHTSPAAKDPVHMEIRGAQFEPYVVAVRTNHPVRFSSQDPSLENIHGTPHAPGNREFNFAIAQPTTRVRESWFRALCRRVVTRRPPPRAGVDRVFPVAEPFIRIKCDVHPWQFAYVCVVDHPFFAITDDSGNFQFPAGLPPGRYVIEARHLRAGSATQEIVLARNERKRLQFALQAPASTAGQQHENVKPSP